MESLIKFKAGESFRAVVPYCSPSSCKVHIDHVLPSIYEKNKLIIYRVYGKHKQHWHEMMCYDFEMEWYVASYCFSGTSAEYKAIFSKQAVEKYGELGLAEFVKALNENQIKL